MKIKCVIFVTLSIALLVSLSAKSRQIYRSYVETIKHEVQLARELPSTDLSGVSINGYKVGEETSIVPYEGWEDDDIASISLTFEDGERENLWIYYYIGGISDSKPRIIEAYRLKDGITFSNNGKAINSPTQLHDFQDIFGDAYLEVPASGSKSCLTVYLDHENKLKLTLTGSDGDQYFYVKLEVFDADTYDELAPRNYTPGWAITGKNPIFYIPRVLDKLNYRYSIFRVDNRGFTESELENLPIYFCFLFLPVFALIVFRNKKMLYLNGGLVIFYIVWALAKALTTHV